MNNDITVIIPTMNRPESLKETIESYMQGEELPAQIVVVDQSQEETIQKKNREMLEAFGNQVQMDYIYQKEPSSTKARNTGIKASKNELLVFSDDDITVKKSTIKDIVQIMKDKSISMVAGINSKDKFGKMKKSAYIFGRHSYKKRNIGHISKAVLGRFPQYAIVGEVETEWAMGFFFIVRKSLVEKWNITWDETLTSYAFGEDMDFSYSYYKKSLEEELRCIFDEKIVVEHRVSMEWRQPTKKSTMMLVINREYFSYKHRMGKSCRLMARWSNFGVFLQRALKRKGGAKDVLWAQHVCNKHRKELAAGIIKPEWYQ